ncbi:MAG: hypothetical protein ABIA75_02330 [Candidatus Neomarinimicrobiota bacterium]
MPESKEWQAFNRKAQVLKDSDRPGVYFKEDPSTGVIWYKGLDFQKGVIECDIRGRDVQGASFVGIAFRGWDAENYDAIYFRPFNFNTADSLRHAHGVQYVSHPEWTWQRLRNERTGRYEQPVTNVPDQTTWFHARIEIHQPQMMVFVNEAAEPALVVDELSERTGGWVGLFMGYGSDGSFANLKITTIE